MRIYICPARLPAGGPLLRHRFKIGTAAARKHEGTGVLKGKWRKNGQWLGNNLFLKSVCSFMLLPPVHDMCSTSVLTYKIRLLVQALILDYGATLGWKGDQEVPRGWRVVRQWTLMSSRIPTTM